MSRITRVLQKVFSLTSGENGVFGSGADNTKVITNDIATLQSKPAWAGGWSDAVLGTRLFPPLEEMNALQYINTSQLAYLFQEGIPEYDANTTYYQKSIVKQPGTYQLYGSKTDNNTGNALADTVNWQALIDVSSTVPNASTSTFGIVRLANEADIFDGSTSSDVATSAQLSAHGFITADIKLTTRSTVQGGWVWAAGTIGDASSNATNRANADTLALFTEYWNNADYTYAGTNVTTSNQLQVYTSGGAAVAKGVSAAADFAAHRQISLVDYRGVFPAGRDNMNGVAAGRLTGQPLGVNGQILGLLGGEESHTMTLAELVAHNHISGYSWGASGSAHPADAANVAGSPNFTGTTGSGTPFNLVPPVRITNIVIKL